MADDDTSPKNKNNNENKDESKQEDDRSSSNGAVNDSLQAMDMRDADESLSSVENNDSGGVGIQLGFAETASLQGLTLSLLGDVTCPLYRAIQQVKEKQQQQQQQQQQQSASSSHLPNPSAHQANVRAEQFHDKMDGMVSDLGTAVQQEAWRQATLSDRHVWMARLFWPRHDDDDDNNNNNNE